MRNAIRPNPRRRTSIAASLATPVAIALTAPLPLTATLTATLALAAAPTLLAPQTAAAQDRTGPDDGSPSSRQLPSTDEVLDYLDELYRSSSSHAVMRMTVDRERGTRELTLESWSRGEDSALVVIREPPREAGTATLRTDEGLWNYAPRADRLIRVPTGLLSDSWMGSHFTNDDLMRETSYDEDYEASLSWTEREGEPYLQVTLTPRPGAPVVYTELRFLLSPGDWIPERWEYLDEGELVRTMTFHDVQEISGQPLPMRMVVRPTDAPDESTVVEYLDLELDVPVDVDLFSRRGLRRIAGS